MGNYLTKKSRDGTVYKSFLGFMGILVVGSISFLILIEVLPKKEIKGVFDKNKILKIALPISLIVLFFLISLASFIHHRMSTDVNKFIGSEKSNVLLYFNSRIVGLLGESTNSRVSEIETVEVKLESKGFAMPCWFTKEFYIYLLVGKDEKRHEQGQYCQNWLNKSCIKHKRSLSDVKELFGDGYIGNQKIKFYSHKMKEGSIEYYSNIIPRRVLPLKDFYYVSQVAVKYSDGSQNIVKYKPESYTDLEINPEIISIINDFSGYKTNPQSHLNYAECEILFGKELNI